MVRGDFEALRRLRERIAEVAREGFKHALLENLAEEALTQVRLGFERSRDPQGDPWAPLKHPSKRRGGAGSQPLRDTGRLMASFTRHLLPNGFTIDSDVDYATVHQGGAVIHRGAGVLMRTRRGRFLSAARAAAANRKSVRVSFHGEYEQRIPARPMLPEGELGPIWSPALERIADRMLDELMR